MARHREVIVKSHKRRLVVEVKREGLTVKLGCEDNHVALGDTRKREIEHHLSAEVGIEPEIHHGHRKMLLHQGAVNTESNGASTDNNYLILFEGRKPFIFVPKLSDEGVGENGRQYENCNNNG